VLEPLANMLPGSPTDFSLEFKARRFLRGSDQNMFVRHQLWLGSFTPTEARGVLCNAGEDPFEPLRGFRSTDGGDWIRDLIGAYATTYLQDDILTKVDRASMAHGLEVRAPFLDPLLVELLSVMPSRLKLRGSETKAILRTAVAPLLPKQTIRRRKKGFGIPVARWMREELSASVAESLSPERLRRQGLFDPAGVAKLLAEHMSAARDHRKELWALFAFQQWHQEWFERPVARPEPVAPVLKRAP